MLLYVHTEVPVGILIKKNSVFSPVTLQRVQCLCQLDGDECCDKLLCGEKILCNLMPFYEDAHMILIFN